MQTNLLVESPITFSPQAIEAIKQIQINENVPEDHKLRIGVKGGGCTGMSYVLGFDEVTENDDQFSVDGIEMIVDRRHAIYITAMHVEFQDGLNARGFIFQNPNAKSTCGCGTSFSA